MVDGVGLRRIGDGGEDDALVVRLRLGFLAEHRGIDVGSFSPGFVAATEAWVVDGHASGTLRSWVAEAEAEGEGGTEPSVGVVSALIRPVTPQPLDARTRESCVVNLWVAPTFRRRGLGRALFDAVVADAAATGCRQVVLHSTDDGRALYESAGLSVESRWMKLPLAGAVTA